MAVKKIDCLLAYPIPTQDSPTKGPALSIFYPGAYLEKKGLNIEYFDQRFDNFKKLEKLLEKKPFCLGVSSMTGFQLIGAKKILKTAKKISPKTFTVFAGVHPSLLPIQSIKESFVDFVIVGEGEQTIFNLIKALKKKSGLKKIKGIYWKKDSQIIANKPQPFLKASQWPFPMTEKSKKYFRKSAEKNELMLPTSRGCPFNCHFCYNKMFNRGAWRQMPFAKFKKELETFIKEFKFSNIYINDDNLGINKKMLTKTAKLLHKHNLVWTTSLRCTDIDDKTAQMLQKNGCREVLLGVESGSNRVLKKIINKDYPKGVDDIKNCAKALSKTSITGRYNFMSGVPGETIKDIKKSMDLADWIAKTHKNAIFCFDAYAPYPGSQLYQKAIKSYFKEPQNLEEWSKVTLSNETNPIAQNLYYLSGLRFRGKKGDATSRNFPGLKRLIIFPFEMSAYLRWKLRFINYYCLEKAIVKKLFKWASSKAGSRN